MNIATFSVIAMIAPLGILPGWFWNKVDNLRSLSTGPVKEANTHRYSQPLPLEVAATLLAIITLFWNVQTLDRITPEIEASLPNRLCRFFALDQSWQMFAPDPPASDCRYRVTAVLNNGKKVEIFSDQKYIRVQRWREYLRALTLKQNEPHRQEFLKFLIERWNKEHRGPWQASVAALQVDHIPRGEVKQSPNRTK